MWLRNIYVYHIYIYSFINPDYIEKIELKTFVCISTEWLDFTDPVHYGSYRYYFYGVWNMNKMLMSSGSINLHFSDSAGVVASVLSLCNFLVSAQYVWV